MSNETVMHSHYVRADKIMVLLHVGLFLFALALANWYGTWLEAFLIGGGTLAAAVVLANVAPGALVTRIGMGAGLMVMTSLHIQQAHGMVEFHFGVFVLLALLLYYKDWIPVLAAAGTIAVHHFLFFYLQDSGSNVWVLETTENGWWVIFLHAGYVIVETAVVLWMANDLKKEAISSAELVKVTDQILGAEFIDLTVRTSGSTDVTAKFDGYTQTIEQLVSQVKQTSETVHTNSAGLVDMTARVKGLSDDQHHQTDMIATAVEEMTTAVAEVSNNATEAAQAASAAQTNAHQCRDYSAETESSIRELERQISSAAETVASLDKEADAIGGVLDVIRGIAEQTNLLALNAAIEAARAGDQGRGFAVVADEVRSLAQRTQESTEEIDKMIEGLQSGSKSAVQVIESSKQHVDSCVEKTHTSMDLMGKVSDTIENINRMNQLIAESAREQTTVTSEISANLTSIVDAGQSVNDQLQSAKQSVEELEKLSEALNHQCARFVISA